MEPYSFEALAKQVSDLWEQLRASMPESVFSRDGATELVRLAQPVEPFNYFDFLAPVVGLAGLLLGLVLAGVAVASLGTLLASLLGLGFLLTEVYGVTLEVEGMPPPPYA